MTPTQFTLRLFTAVTLTGLAVVAVIQAQDAKPARPQPNATARPQAADTKAVPPAPALKVSAEAAEIRKTGEAFVEAFNAGDAKAVAAFWTEAGEYVGPDGVTISGREEIEKDHAEFFKSNPRAKLTIDIGSIRVLGKNLAAEEGTLKVENLGKDGSSTEPNVSVYSVLHVREGDAWKMASVKEWVPTADQLASPKDLEWLLGDWVARSGDSVIETSYAWDDTGAFMVERYTLLFKGEKVAAGKQLIGRNPEGGLRAWLFHDHGGFGESFWSKDGNHWNISVSGTLPDGTSLAALNVLIPVDKNTFTWQSVDRYVGDAELPDLPPVKVTRVVAKGEKPRSETKADTKTESKAQTK